MTTHLHKYRKASNFDGTSTVYTRDTSFIVYDNSDFDKTFDVYSTLYKHWVKLHEDLTPIKLAKKRALANNDRDDYLYNEKAFIAIVDKIYEVETAIQDLKKKLSTLDAGTKIITHENSHEDYGFSKIVDNLVAKQYGAVESLFGSMFDEQRTINSDPTVYEDPGIVSGLPVIRLNTGAGIKESLISGAAGASRDYSFVKTEPTHYVTIYKVSTLYSPKDKSYVETKSVASHGNTSYYCYSEEEAKDMLAIVSNTLNSSGIDPESYFEAVIEGSIGANENSRVMDTKTAIGRRVVSRYLK